ncbi:hypothetical protein SFHH103_01686 [Sinorhizobium fredii HH103]|uniref:Uncharacterized protein n=1 Tax=Sinorhizobium fredii (strain HH103) TaxID=1117943 RepID=G9A7F3_SINF1|nr:hypothetical protein [Sinorhizobium fredii]CCE96183.1 hypothetical protein SFHH103_01686 [Sinorhizobium fredii HH103]
MTGEHDKTLGAGENDPWSAEAVPGEDIVKWLEYRAGIEDQLAGEASTDLGQQAHSFDAGRYRKAAQLIAASTKPIGGVNTNHRAAIDAFNAAADRTKVIPSTVRTAFLDQNVKLPLRLCEEEVGVVLDDDGVDVFTVDSNGGRPDEEVSTIALLIVECVNAEAGFGEERTDV